MKKDTLKEQNPWASTNLIDLFRILDPTKTNKYLPFLTKHFKRIIDEWNERNKKDIKYQIEDIRKTYGVTDSRNLMSNLNGIELDILHRILSMGNRGHNIIKVLHEFNTHCESNRIVNKDISTYNTIEEIVDANHKADLILLKSNKKHDIHVVMENDTWVMLKPLTFEASLKYGASTKWCTAMKNAKEHFVRYTRNGVLIYVINKNTANKTACYIESYGEVSTFGNPMKIYNSMDVEMDSYMVGYDSDVMEVLMSEFEKKETNLELIMNKYPKLYEELQNEYEKSAMIGLVNPTELEEPLDLVPAWEEIGFDDTFDIQVNDDFEAPTEGTTTVTWEYNENGYDEMVNEIKSHTKRKSLFVRWFMSFFRKKIIVVGVPNSTHEELTDLHHRFNGELKTRGYLHLFYPTFGDKLKFTEI